MATKNVANSTLRRKHVEQLMKTQMCKFYAQNNCWKGARCCYAHDPSEIRDKPDLANTSMCPSFLQTGNCDNPDCAFAHSERQLRTTNSFFKTKICRFAAGGQCKLGNACRFAHVTTELSDNAVERQVQQQLQPPQPMQPNVQHIEYMQQQPHKQFQQRFQGGEEWSDVSQQSQQQLLHQQMKQPQLQYEELQPQQQLQQSQQLPQLQQQQPQQQFQQRFQGGEEWSDVSQQSQQQLLHQQMKQPQLQYAELQPQQQLQQSQQLPQLQQQQPQQQFQHRFQGGEEWSDVSQQCQQQFLQQQMKQPQFQYEELQPQQQLQQSQQLQQLQQLQQQQQLQLQRFPGRKTGRDWADTSSEHSTRAETEHSGAVRIPNDNFGQEERDVLHPAQHPKQSLDSNRSACPEARPTRHCTTMMLTNVPTFLTQGALVSLLEDLTKDMRGAFDFFYCPWDPCEDRNLGYAIINFFSRSCAADFERTWSNKPLLDGGRGMKKLRLMPAALQGRAANLRHFSGFNLAHHADSRFRPLVRAGVGAPLRPMAVYYDSADPRSQEGEPTEPEIPLAPPFCENALQ